MRPYRHVEGVYAVAGKLPEGCKRCLRGEKVVVFVTGLCRESCFYCPVSPERFNHDVVYTDEERVHSIEDIVAEVYRVGATGASITGGEPLLKLDRVSRIVSRLKREFGDGFHVHLYTTGRGLTPSIIQHLESIGVDELRIHVVNDEFRRHVEVALEYRSSMHVGVEIPVDPLRVEWIRRLILWLDKVGADFINLNELEVAPHRLDVFASRGYEVRGYVVQGSYEAGVEIVKWAAANTRRLDVHFCPASFKDAVQHRNRLLRKALRVARFYERVTPRGTLEYCVVEGKDCEAGVLVGGECRVHPEAARPPCLLVEVYPDTSRRLVSTTPLEDL